MFRSSLARSIILAGFALAPSRGIFAELPAFDSSEGSPAGKRPGKRNPSYTKKGPGRRFAGRHAQIMKHPVVKRYFAAQAIAQKEGGAYCPGAPCAWLLKEYDKVAMREGVVYIKSHMGVFGKVRVA
jgi:hypothetical protein